MSVRSTLRDDGSCVNKSFRNGGAAGQGTVARVAVRRVEAFELAG
jgi:hypothetical protein